MQGYDGYEPTWELQAHVNSDLRVITAYGERHPAQYGGCWLQHTHLYGASFTSSIGDHIAELEALVDLPERLRVNECSHSLAELRETEKTIVQAEMKPGADGSIVVTGVVGVAPRVKQNVVEVYVQPGHPDVEVRLRATYGDLVSVVPGAVAEAF